LPELATVRAERGTHSSKSSAASDGRNPLLGLHQFFRQGPASAEGWSQLVSKGREWESFYRDRRQHDKIVRSTHGVNCTGSCSWNVYVKEGIITWESQAVDYPSTGPDSPAKRTARIRNLTLSSCLERAGGWAGRPFWVARKRKPGPSW
jgi:hypothetical protein